MIDQCRGIFDGDGGISPTSCSHPYLYKRNKKLPYLLNNYTDSSHSPKSQQRLHLQVSTCRLRSTDTVDTLFELLGPSSHYYQLHCLHVPGQ